MNKRLKLALAALLVSSSAFATEMRTPWIAERGPLRYTFEKLHECKSNMNYWSSAHYKYADRAFLKHSTESQQLTALFFNKADFKFAETFPNSDVPMNAEEYSPFLKLSTFSPRASYTEWGATMGGRWDVPVWVDCGKVKGRLGLRGTVPFRAIEIEREDITDKNTNPLDEFVATKVMKIDRNSPVNNVDAGATDAAAVAGAQNRDGSANAQASVRAAVNAVAALNAKTTVVGFVANADAATSRAAANQQTDAQAVADATPAIGVGSAGATIVTAATVPGTSTSLANILDGTGVNNTPDATATQVVAAVIEKAAGNGPINAMLTGAAAAINAAANRGDRAAIGNQSDIVVNAYRLDFVAALPGSDGLSSVRAPAVTNIQIFGNNVGVAEATQKNRAPVGLTRATSADDVETTGYVAWMPANVSDTKGHVLVTDIIKEPATLTPDPTNAAASKIGVFDSGTDYRGLFTGAAGSKFTDAAAAQAAELWLTFRRAADSGDTEKFSRDTSGSVAGNGGVIAHQIENLLQLYRENPLLFFERNGISFDGRRRTGLGDIDLDLFYEHTFGCDLVGELFVGVRFPTGCCSHIMNGSPYEPTLGNGGHWEVKLGGLLAYQAFRLMNIKLDAYYSFVLENTEHVPAAFKGATIKNIGPRVDADNDWGYFVGRLDFNFFHPKDSCIRSTVGYEFYYKTQDHTRFKNAKATSFLGKLIDSTTGLPIAGSDQYDLDNALARKNTESISHKLRGETSAQVLKYFEVYAGGTWTFAGQNVMKDFDAHAGFNVRF